MDEEDQQEDRTIPPVSDAQPYRIVSDMNLGGRYEESILEMTDAEIRSFSAGALQVSVPLADVQFVINAEYVGNGILEAQTRDGRLVTLIRYSRTLSERFEQAELEINRRLGRELTIEERERQRGDIPVEYKLTYRCPNCGYPLGQQGDVCPRCVSVRSMMLRLVAYLKPYWKEATVGLVLALVLTALALIPGVILRDLIDGPLHEPELLPEEQAAATQEVADESKLFANEQAYALAIENGVSARNLRDSSQHGRMTKVDVEEYLKERKRFVSPEAQELAHKLLVSPKVVKGTGPDGRLTEEDINLHAAETQDLPASRDVRRWAFETGVDLRQARGTGPEGQILIADVKEASKPQRYRTVALLVSALLGVFIVRALISVWRTYIMGALGAKLIHDIRSELYRSLQRLSLSFYDHHHTGRIMSRVTSDTSVLNSFVVGGFPNMLTDTLTIIGIGIVMMAFHWKLALLTLLATPLMVLGTYFFARQMRLQYRRVSNRYATVYKVLNEAISGVRVVRAFGQEEREINTFVDKSAHYRAAVVDTVKLKSIFTPSMVFLTALGMVIIYSYGGYLVIRGDLKLGILVMFNTYMVQFYMPIRQLTELTDMFQQTAVSAERVFGILDTPSDVADATNSKPLTQVRGHVAFESVDFAYEKGERVLKNINLDVKPGEIIGLVGQTGSGKSTLVRLLARFYDPTRGRVLIDGHDLREIRLKDLRRHVGMVLQETFLFTGTLRENIAYGRPEATNEQVIEAARAANAHDFIMDMPDGYDTYVGERGVGLSGGEQQRIAIARAIMIDPAILILDEATSSVDTATEAMIQEALERLMAGRTTFAIAHRLSTLKNSNRLVVLSNGEITETGTHEELLAHENGIYRNLVEIQNLLSGAPTPQIQPAT